VVKGISVCIVWDGQI